MSCPHCYHQGRVSWRLEIRQYGSSPNQPEEHNSPCLSSKYIHCLVTWNMSISPWLYAQLHVCQHALSAKILLNCQLKGTNLFLRKASHGSPWLTSFSSLNVSLGCAPAFFVLAIPLQQLKTEIWAPPSSCSIPRPTLDLGTRPTKRREDALHFTTPEHPDEAV